MSTLEAILFGWGLGIWTAVIIVLILGRIFGRPR